MTQQFNKEWFGPLVTSLSGFAQRSTDQARISLLPDDDEEDDPEEILEVETHILGSTCTLIDKITGSRSDLLSGPFDSASTSPSSGKPIVILLDMLENARVPDHWKDCVPEQENADGVQPAQAGFDTDKFMGQAKAVLMKCVVEACAETDLSDRTDHKEVWERFQRWMKMGLTEDCAGRSDLVGCALLAMGNQVRSGKSTCSMTQNRYAVLIRTTVFDRCHSAGVCERHRPLRDLQKAPTEFINRGPAGPVRHCRLATEFGLARHAQRRTRTAGDPSLRGLAGL